MGDNESTPPPTPDQTSDQGSADPLGNVDNSPVDPDAADGGDDDAANGSDDGSDDNDSNDEDPDSDSDSDSGDDEDADGASDDDSDGNDSDSDDADDDESDDEASDDDDSADADDDDSDDDDSDDDDDDSDDDDSDATSDSDNLQGLSGASSTAPDSSTSCTKKHWVGVHAIFEDDQSDVPAADCQHLNGNTVNAGPLAMGKLETHHLEAGSYQVTFPDIDASEWSVEE